jgi:hypothetical protein
VSAREALQQADYIYIHREGLTRDKRIEAIRMLAAHGVFSDAQIARITGASTWFVHQHSDKADHTGGRFDPAGIDSVLALIDLRQHGLTDVFAVRRALDECCGPYLLARLTGWPVSTIKRHAERALALSEPSADEEVDSDE